MKAEKNLRNVIYEVQDATKLPTEWTETFDLIVCYDVIHDMGRADLGVKELSRVLKKGTTVNRGRMGSTWGEQTSKSKS